MTTRPARVRVVDLAEAFVRNPGNQSAFRRLAAAVAELQEARAAALHSIIPSPIGARP